jgi:molecular chaperone DnaJ
MAAQREWYEKDYYKVLGVSDTATEKELTKAYRKLARQHHPDANQGDLASEEKFKEISAAYDVVGDPAKRKEYDEARRLGPMAGGFGGGQPGGAGGGSFNFDVGDLIGNLFNRGGNRRGAQGAGPQRGADVEAELTLNFLDAVNGITTTLQLNSDATCSTCHGTGARPGTSPRLCQVCGGRGSVDDNQGPFSFSSPCYACGGRGQIVDSPCPTCSGSGTERRLREVKVRIPAGVDDGQRIRLRGKGSPGRNGGPAGDLIVLCHVSPHPVFGRDALNLTVRVPITFAEAALGGEIEVPVIDGTRVKLRLAPGTQTGTRQRVKGKGVAAAKGSGDLVVTFEVVVPNKLSGPERKAIEELARVSKSSPRAHLEV